ncbi:MAG: hypothetical protein ACFFDI_14870 [Promethearchaeota archaeon]
MQRRRMMFGLIVLGIAFSCSIFSLFEGVPSFIQNILQFISLAAVIITIFLLARLPLKPQSNIRFRLVPFLYRPQSSDIKTPNTDIKTPNKPSKERELANYCPFCGYHVVSGRCLECGRELEK